MNVASRMESTGEKGRIQVSEETATLLKNAGIHLTPREEKVAAKGKGLLQTYWLDAPSCSGDETERDGASVVEEVSESEQAMNRLVDWNTCNLVQLLRVVQARRIALNSTQAEQDANDPAISEHQRAVEEVDEVIELPSFMAAAAEYRVDLLALRMKPEIIDEARNYIWTIAMWYQRNHFHNFEHASHVVMSVLKLLSRISAVKSGDTTSVEAGRHHEDTYGIASDPLTCFACVFAALIHDVDHCGIPNVELVKENAPLAKLYKSQSVAEQNSIDVAWKLLLEDRFSNFREAIFTNNDERRRFRKLLVASVIATDVMDKELKDLRNKRWDMAFGATRETEECASSQSNSSSSKSDDDERINRKATVVIEHLIQASDVCHTMQHWHVYREWNEKLYMEMYQAYMDGRTNSDPTDRWFDGELWFFDHYIIPLAKKLAHCDVFGKAVIARLAFAERHISYCFASRHVYLFNRSL
jgi:3'5'-cyclic nucleotide phosphodiesterase/Adenylate and Guanylate cyclase catalytic domain